VDLLVEWSEVVSDSVVGLLVYDVAVNQSISGDIENVQEVTSNVEGNKENNLG
jgi:hypothetical protein